MKTIHEFITQNDIHMTSERIEARTDSQKEFQGASHWKCLIKMGKRRMTVEYSMGAAHSHRIGPALADVLDSLASDANGTKDQGFNNWCDDYGYDNDSRKAEATYKACCKILSKLAKFFKNDAILTEFLEGTERL